MKLSCKQAMGRIRQLLMNESYREKVAKEVAQDLSVEFEGQFTYAEILQRAKTLLGVKA